MNPCVPLASVRVGDCGDYPPNPTQRHPYAHDGAMYTRTNSVHESQPGFSRGRVMVFDHPKALSDHRPATN